MYGAIWRILPGPRWVKAVEALVLLLAVVAVLFTWVFPWVAEQWNLLDTTVGEASGLVQASRV